ncbi:MAG: hypothetical protein N2558_03265 [Patescibacteria group bacterium]|nr:hypothetical protein [Patescibacteria group bacterium]
MREKLISHFKSRKLDLLVIFFAFIFSTFLYWKTLYIKDNQMFIATKVWSDFGATLPVARSFSYGFNFPPQYPHFAHEPIRYHFLFYLFVGLLEKYGIRLDYALNTLSAIGMTLLIYFIYKGGEVLFKNKVIGILSLLFFIFNGSFGFLEYFKANGINISSILQIPSNQNFTSFGPYDEKIVSAFWSLNIYTNQRHLALGYAIFLGIFLYLYHRIVKHKSISYNAALIIGILVGFIPFLHLAVYAMIGVAVLLFFLIFSHTRKQLFLMGFVAIILALPQFIYMGSSRVESELIKIGYLAKNISEIPYYWLLNLGLLIVFIPIGFLLANKNQKKAFLVFLTFFIIANTFRLSPEIAANHKFINMFVIGMNWFLAFSIITLWGKFLMSKLILTISILFLTLTGIIDLFPIINDKYVTIDDIPKNKIANFIDKNTTKDAIFLNSSFTFHPALIAGRKIFLGWPYYAWSAGYDTDHRNKIFTKMYTSTNKFDFCKMAIENNIDYVTVEDTKGDTNLPTINTEFFKNNFKLMYEDIKENYFIFSIKDNCA